LNFTDIGDLQDYRYSVATVVSVDNATDTCVLSTGETALIFYHCLPESELRDNGAIVGGAKGFRAGQGVVVLKKFDGSKIYVIGHTNGITRCEEDDVGEWYIFYRDGATLKVARCSYLAEVLTQIENKPYTDLATTNTTDPVTMHLKKFRHVVNGTLQDLYFVATSLYITPNPYPGWVAFAAANPAFPLVTNNSDSKITMTTELMTDLNAMNAYVNDNFTYASDPVGNDYWHLMTPGQTGDCEDFALTKAMYLLGLGYPASAIHIECAQIDGSDRGHAWCVVQTTAGDYALDLGSNVAVKNSSLKPATLPPPAVTPLEYTGRRRQIGSKWAFISPYGWMSGSGNVTAPGGTAWYILDPLLNIFYNINTYVWAYPFAQVTNVAGDELSTPSINFSENNTQIHIAENGTIKTYTLNENSLDIISSSSYTSRGFVGRNGLIVEPVGLFGRQDPYGGWDGNVFLNRYGDPPSPWWLSRVLAPRQGAFKTLYGCKIISKDGYYDYEYRYRTGIFDGSGNVTGYVDGDGSEIQSP
jgi:predicted transglutaminase-like cysteine proteinase